MAEFAVHGPYEIFLDRNRIVEERTISKCEELKWCKKKRGVYVFFCAGANPRPVYVGKTTRGINKEAFNCRNIKDLNGYLHRWGKCRLHMYGVVRADKKDAGRVGDRLLDRMETCLITLAMARNPRRGLNDRKLRNYKSCAHRYSWKIPGVIPFDTTRTNTPFRRLMWGKRTKK